MSIYSCNYHSYDVVLFQKFKTFADHISNIIKQLAHEINLKALAVFESIFSCFGLQKKYHSLITFHPGSFNGLSEKTSNFFQNLNKPAPSVIHGAAMSDLHNQEYLRRHTELVNQCYTQAWEQKYSGSPLMGRVNWIPGDFGLWMGGMALIVSHFIEKYGFKEFYVCETLEGFSKKLEQFVENPQAKRGAFIVPCFAAGSQHHGVGFRPNFPQHKVTVVVEKVPLSGQIKLAILDGQPEGNNPVISPEKIGTHGDLWKGWQCQGCFNSQELVLRAVMNAKLPRNTQLFHSAVPRERSYGCSSFAIRDGIAFLRDPAFFDKIVVDQKPPLQVSGLPLKTITQLPPDFMIGTQSLRQLHTYIKNNSSKDLTVKKKEGKDKTLFDYLKKYNVQEKNHYITIKACRYNELVLQMLISKTPSEIDDRLSKVLVR
jgi:hypothetical protein